MKTKIIIESGRRRRAIQYICKWCDKKFWGRRQNKARPYGRRYCSISCRDSARRSRQEVTCAQCGKKLLRKQSQIKSEYQFCSRICKDTAQRLEGISAIHPSHYGNGASSYRERAFRYYGKKCCVCGYNKITAMLDAHHIGDPNDHSIPNLAVRCVWCHALITRGVIKKYGAVAQFGRASPLQGEG